jgi:NAD(P)-dependent dehydrogenase (short-subunit alcohol dehydrogenase family)
VAKFLRLKQGSACQSLSAGISSIGGTAARNDKSSIIGYLNLLHERGCVSMSNNTLHLKGKTALVTGASRGIGRGIAIRLAQCGAAVAVNFLNNEAAAKETVSRTNSDGGQAFAVRANVARPDELAEMVEGAHKHLGALDIFVHNALGDLLGFMSPPLQVTLKQWNSAVQCQQQAFLTGVQVAAPLLRSNGRIVAMSYWPGSHLGGFLPYFAMGANKAGIEAMCRYFAVALAPRGITVNAICAGITDDSIVNQLPPQATEAMLAWLRDGWNPMGRPGKPADVGGAVAALCSDDAGWITGQTIVADGGASLMSPEVPRAFQNG